jgi:Kef-type K+ transport system membrane component KefB
MPSFRLIAGYLCLVGLPLLVFLAIVNSGGTFAQPALVLPPPTIKAAPANGPIVSGSFLLMFQIILILAATRIAGTAFRRIGQPQVIGEMVAGVMLGPSVAGWFSPAVSEAVFPASSLGQLEVLSQLGLVVFMFLVGVSLDTDSLREHCHVAILTSHVSIVMPLVLGTALASLLYPSFAGGGVGFPAFALFMGTAMSITAFPVLARILSERNLLRSGAGTLAIACAAVDDVTGWCILAYITVLIRTSRSVVPMSLTILGSLMFAALMVFAVRRFLSRFEDLFEPAEAADRILVPIVLFLLVSSLTTEFLGVHPLFGSFLAGAVMPKSHRTRAYLQGRLEPFCLAVLMPLFFAFTGLRTNLGLLRDSAMWKVFGLIVTVAVAGKLGGATIAARLAGFGWRDSAAVGSLLNTRGLMELVILNIGLEVGILTPALYTLMVMMAILTTFMTAPLLHWLRPPSLVPVRVRYEENEQRAGPVPG